MYCVFWQCCYFYCRCRVKFRLCWLSDTMTHPPNGQLALHIYTVHANTFLKMCHIRKS